METIADILAKVTANLKSNTSDIEPEPERVVGCPTCNDRKWITPIVELGDPRFGKAIHCPTCSPKPESFFANLEVTDDNKAAIRAAMQMAIHPQGWLVLVGERGVGKTTILRAIISSMRGSLAHPLTASNILDYWRDAMDSGGFQPNFARMQAQEVMAIDDLAAPKRTEWAEEKLVDLLGFRYERRMATILTTDLDEVQLAKAWGQRLADRVFDRGTGLCTIRTVGGPSRRTGRKW